MKYSSVASRTVRTLALALGVAALSTTVVQAHPSASGVTNAGGTIQFVLNENAFNVGVTFDNNTVSNNLGALNKGSQSFALGIHTNFSIYVFNVGSGTPTQISSDANPLLNFV